jgi:uracil-DNA glycosylase
MNSTVPNTNCDIDTASLLPWLVDMGADEVLLDHAVNRFAATPPVQETPEPAKPRAALLNPRPAKPATNWQAVAAGAEGVAAAQAIAASIATVETYLEALDAFDVHPLKRTASRAAAFSGALQPKVLVLCDKARNEEDRTGDVLAGNNLVLAERMLSAIGLSRADEQQPLALANFIPWRPPGNRAVTEQEGLMLAPLVLKLISILQPKLILCFGPLAGQYLAGGEEAVMKQRGKWLNMAGIPALTTFHPETLLKSPASKRLAWHDLQAFKHKLDELT